ncbi:unnamed protein product [Symbiodinium sp. KB8]|nr:unnamed protein product [Symbiodinium sp. KB8]
MWDKTRLVEDALHGTGREYLFQRVDRHLQSALANIPSMLNPDKMWHVFNSAIRDAAVDVYQLPAKKVVSRPTDTAEAIDNMLEAKNSLVSYQTICLGHGRGRLDGGDFLQLPGPQGGCSATVVEWDQVAHAAEVDDRLRLINNLDVLGKWFYDTLWQALEMAICQVARPDDVELLQQRVELCVRRLQYWQSVAKCPHLHKTVLAAVFGKLHWDSAASVRDDGGFAACVNPWVGQFQEDMVALLKLDSAAERLHGIGDRFFLVFTDYRADFLAIDCTELRSSFFSVCVPPPGVVIPMPQSEEQQMQDQVGGEVEERQSFACDCKCEDGSTCVIPPMVLVCPICDDEKSSLHELLQCIAQHFPQAQEGARPVKQQRVQDDEGLASKEKKMLEMLAKLCLKNSLEIRELQSAILCTFIVPRDSAIAVAGSDAAKNHVERMKAVQGNERKIDALGPIHVHVWASIVNAAVGSAATKEDADILKEHFDSITKPGSDPNSIALHVHVARFSKAWDKGTVKLHLACRSDWCTVFESLERALVASGAKRKLGQAPRGGLERQIRELLDALQ